MARNNPKALGSANESERELAKAIFDTDLTQGHRAAEWFTKMVDDCLAGFGKKLEALWTDEEIKVLKPLGSLYAKAVIDNPFKDVLGGIYQELSSNFGRKGMGQFFTPDALAEMMAKITYNGDLFESQEVVRLYEPTTGSGVLVLSFMESIMQDNPKYMDRFSITCVDLDLLCVKMSVLQVMANNYIHQCFLGEINAYHGNSLANPKQLSLFYGGSTPAFMANQKKEKERLAQEAQINAQQSPTPDPSKPKDQSKQPAPNQPTKGQMNLF